MLLRSCFGAPHKQWQVIEKIINPQESHQNNPPKMWSNVADCCKLWSKRGQENIEGRQFLKFCQ